MILRLCRPLAFVPPLFTLGALGALGACSSSTPEAAPPPPPPEAAASTEILAPPVAPPADQPGSDPNLVVGSDPCQSDEDCIPAACCHAAACVGKQNAKVCNMMCTQECRPGTIDCGGGCLCHEGHCAAKLGSTPDR